MAEQIQFVLKATDATSAVVDKVRGSFGLLERKANDLKDSFGRGLTSGITAALAPAAVVAFVTGVSRGVDALNDLSDASGASVENISALEDVAARTGTSFEAVGTSLVRFNAALNDAKPGSQAAEVLKSLGLDAKRLKELDPAEALRQTAVALSRFADDGNKARAVQELFGKSLREVAPFLKDLATQSELVGRLTGKQAEEAERFVNALGALQKNTIDASRALVSELAPALTDIVKALADAKEEASSFGLLGAAIVVPLQAITVFGANVAFVFRGVGREIGAIVAQLAALGRGDFAGFSAISESVIEDGKKARAELEAFENRVMGVTRALDEAARRAEDRKFKPNLGGLQVGGDIERVRRNVAKKIIGEDVIEQMNKALVDAAEAFVQADFVAAQEFAKLLGEAAAKRFDSVSDAFRRSELEATEAVNKALKESQIKERFEEISEFARQAQRNIQNALGDTLEELLRGNFDSIGDLWKDLLIRMVAQATATRLNEALFGIDNKSGLLGPFLSTIFGGFRATGGPVTAGQSYVVGERGPEMFIPSTSGTVQPNGWGGVTITQNISVGSGVNRNDLALAMTAAKNSAKAEIADLMRRGSPAF